MPERPLRVVMVSSEVEGFARTGGLGDVVAASSRALADLGVDVTVVTPLYGITKVPADARWWSAPVEARVGWGASDVWPLGVLETRIGGARVCLLANHHLYGARDGIYGDALGTFGDNALRFAALSRGALSVCDRLWGTPASAGGGVDVIHAHDWHAALAVIYPKLVMGEGWQHRRAVFTIHNLAYQGVLGTSELDPLGIPRAAWTHGWVSHEGNVNLMKGAIELADRVTTVSETYAKEILTPADGYGLDAHLRWHAGKLVGIVNGIDMKVFDPSHDPAIARRYGQEDALAGKRACKRALLEEMGLDGDLDAPLFSSVSRLTWQKGIDMVVDAVPWLVSRGNARVVFVGQGDTDLEAALRALDARFPGRVAARITFDGKLARRIFAGSDFLFVPSRYEPCGLTQMYAMRYGAVPIVTPVGGLKDTVEPLDLVHDRGTGVVMRMDDPHPLLLACEDALAVYGDARAWKALVQRAMARDSSWETSARRYLELYRSMGRPG